MVTLDEANRKYQIRNLKKKSGAMMPYFPKKVENVMVQIGLSQRSYQRWLDKRTCKKEMKIKWFKN